MNIKCLSMILSMVVLAVLPAHAGRTDDPRAWERQGDAVGAPPIAPIPEGIPVPDMDGVKQRAQAASKELGPIDAKPAFPAAASAYKGMIDGSEVSKMIPMYQEDLWRKLEQQSIPQSKKGGTEKGAPRLDKQRASEYIAKNHTPGDYEGVHVFVALSSSMPEPVVRNYLKFADGTPGVRFIIRGTIGDPKNLKPTARWFARMLCGTEKPTPKTKCLDTKLSIDPNSFRKYRVESVPTVVYVPDAMKIAACGDVTGVTDNDWYAFRGDVPLTYALERLRFARPNDAKLAEIEQSVRRHAGKDAYFGK